MREARGNSTPDGEYVWIDHGPRKPGTFDMTEAQLREYDPGRKTRLKPRPLTAEQAQARAAFLADSHEQERQLREPIQYDPLEVL